MRIGVLGGGQLARMLAMAGAPLGLRFRCFDTTTDAPARDVCELHVGAFADPVAIDRFLRGVDVVTYEFENIPASVVESIERTRSVLPGSIALRTGQDRIAEKSFFRNSGLAVHDFRAADSREAFDSAIAEIGLPAVVKTTRMGYDGKGQAVVRSTEDAAAAWAKLGASPLIVEKFVPFTRELSAIAVRSPQGEVRFYDWVENVHEGGILRLSRAPARGVPETESSHVRAQIAGAMDQMRYVGVMAVELFDVGGKLLFNEMAPRVHNSGHWTIEGARCSQFENHCRAVAGLPLGSTACIAPAAMVNLIGGLPAIADVLGIPGAHPHFYGKEPRAGRKVGHITVIQEPGMSGAEFEASVERARALAPKG
ncbi:MAG: 5-(carboxyamino)imidazole ribonucleotide synthase [Phycisphaerales bacterium]